MAYRRTGNYTPFGKEVSKRMIDLNMNNTVLAEQIGVKPSYINDILQGTRKALARKKQIAKIVGIRFEDYEGCC